MTHTIRVIAVPTEKRLIESRHDDPNQALLDALGQVPLGFTIATVELDPD